MAASPYPAYGEGVAADILPDGGFALSGLGRMGCSRHIAGWWNGDFVGRISAAPSGRNKKPGLVAGFLWA